MKVLRIVLSVALMLMLAVTVSQAAPPQVGQVMEGFTLNDKDGNPVDIQFTKKATILSFWVSSCALCKQELAVLNKLGEEYKGKDLDIIVVSTDFGGPEIVEYVLRKTKTEAKVPILYDKGLLVSGGQFGVAQFPFLIVLDKEGKVTWYLDGWHEDTEARLRSEIAYRIK
jgi:peroxiredoxin